MYVSLVIQVFQYILSLISFSFFLLLKNHEDFAGKTFELAGPAEYSYKEVVEFVSDVTTLKIPLVDVPVKYAQMVGRLTENMISPILTEDMVNQMTENVVAVKNANCLTLSDLNIEPASMDKFAFDFLHRFRPGGHFTIVKGYH